MKKSSIITWIIIFAVILISFYALNKNGKNQDNELAKCIASKSALYTQTGCFACQKQESLFGDTYKNLNVINCAMAGNICLNEDITATPTWIINGEKYVGVQTIEKLKELTNC